MRAGLVLGLAMVLALAAGCEAMRSKTAPPPATTTADGTPVIGGGPSAAQVPEPVTTWSMSEAPAVPEGLHVHRLLKTVTFPAGSSTLNQEAKGALIEAVKEMKTNSRWHALAVGFTDNRGEAGQGSSLSMARAQAVRSYLAGQGIAEGRISVQAMGSRYAQGGDFEPEAVARDRHVQLWAFM